MQDKAGNEEYSKVYGLFTEQYENTVNVSANDLTYNGSEQELVTVTHSQEDVYFNTETELNSENYSSFGNTEIPKFTEAGTYTVYWYTPGNVAYIEKAGRVEVTINKQIV